MSFFSQIRTYFLPKVQRLGLELNLNKRHVTNFSGQQFFLLQRFSDCYSHKLVFFVKYLGYLSISFPKFWCKAFKVLRSQSVILIKRLTPPFASARFTWLQFVPFRNTYFGVIAWCPYLAKYAYTKPWTCAKLISVLRVFIFDIDHPCHDYSCYLCGTCWIYHHFSLIAAVITLTISFFTKRLSTCSLSSFWHTFYPDIPDIVLPYSPIHIASYSLSRFT